MKPTRGETYGGPEGGADGEADATARTGKSRSAAVRAIVFRRRIDAAAVVDGTMTEKVTVALNAPVYPTPGTVGVGPGAGDELHPPQQAATASATTADRMASRSFIDSLRWEA
jgi:hypothetical protein